MFIQKTIIIGSRALYEIEIYIFNLNFYNTIENVGMSNVKVKICFADLIKHPHLILKVLL